MRVIAGGFVVGIVGVAGVGMAGTLRDHDGADSSAVTVKQEGAADLHRVPVLTSAKSATPKATPEASEPSSPVAPPADATAPIASTSVGSAPESHRMTAIIAEGRTTLTDSIYAVRTGDSILVNFDAHGGRTGRADKFETLLRTTLPLVYGRSAMTGLDSVPTGSLLPTRDVIRALPLSGMVLTMENGTKISIRPQTRMTSDGPLLVSYITVVQR